MSRLPIADTVTEAHGLRCPECRRDTDIRIYASNVIAMTPTPEGVESDTGDTTWDDCDGCECQHCGFEGRVENFDIKNQPTSAIDPGAIAAIVTATINLLVGGKGLPEHCLPKLGLLAEDGDPSIHDFYRHLGTTATAIERFACWNIDFEKTTQPWFDVCIGEIAGELADLYYLAWRQIDIEGTAVRIERFKPASIISGAFVRAALHLPLLNGDAA